MLRLVLEEHRGGGQDEWIVGSWALTAWRRIAGDGTITFPLGDDARGSLIYTSDRRMSVHMAAAERQRLGTTDPLGGDVAARADAYSTYLAYWGTYELRDSDAIVHRIDTSLFPDWSGEEQVRNFTCHDDELVLRTPPMQVTGGSTVVNELAWIREVH